MTFSSSMITCSCITVIFLTTGVSSFNHSLVLKPSARQLALKALCPAEYIRTSPSSDQANRLTGSSESQFAKRRLSNLHPLESVVVLTEYISTWWAVPTARRWWNRPSDALTVTAAKTAMPTGEDREIWASDPVSRLAKKRRPRLVPTARKLSLGCDPSTAAIQVTTWSRRRPGMEPMLPYSHMEF